MTNPRVLATTTILLSVLLTLGLAEALLRVALFSEGFVVKSLRQPWRYADSFLDGDYWKLATLFGTVDGAMRAGAQHTTLGWSPILTAENPLGIYADSPPEPSSLREPVLVYGDSFIAGATPMHAKIPQLLESLGSGRVFVNLGVSGFGVDQIFLRYLETVDRFASPTVVVGILMDDVNRSIMPYRMAPKPYFEVESGRLALRASTVTQTPAEYLAEHPPEIRSYLFRLAMFRIRDALPDGLFNWMLGYDRQIERIREVNRLILESLRDEASRRRQPLFVILFYGVYELERPVWQEQFLKDTLRDLGIPYYDTRPAIEAAMRTGGSGFWEFYYRHNNHPNELGNQLIAEGFHRWLVDRGAL